MATAGVDGWRGGHGNGHTDGDGQRYCYVDTDGDAERNGDGYSHGYLDAERNGDAGGGCSADHVHALHDAP